MSYKSQINGKTIKDIYVVTSGGLRKAKDMYSVTSNGLRKWVHDGVTPPAVEWLSGAYDIPSAIYDKIQAYAQNNTIAMNIGQFLLTYPQNRWTQFSLWKSLPFRYENNSFRTTFNFSGDPNDYMKGDFLNDYGTFTDGLVRTKRLDSSNSYSKDTISAMLTQFFIDAYGRSSQFSSSVAPTYNFGVNDFDNVAVNSVKTNALCCPAFMCVYDEAKFQSISDEERILYTMRVPHSDYPQTFNQDDWYVDIDYYTFSITGQDLKQLASNTEGNRDGEILLVVAEPWGFPGETRYVLETFWSGTSAWPIYNTSSLSSVQAWTNKAMQGRLMTLNGRSLYMVYIESLMTLGMYQCGIVPMFMDRMDNLPFN